MGDKVRWEDSSRGGMEETERKNVLTINFERRTGAGLLSARWQWQGRV